MKKIYSLLLVLCLLGTQLTANLFAQGCVAIRGMSACSPGATSADFFKQQNGKFQINAGYRFFRSFRHFRGDHEESERVENGTEVINVAHALDLGLTYQPSTRWSISVNLPIQHNDRSSLYEHYGNPVTANPEQKRFHTGSKGIGDLRISTSYWLRDPLKMPKFNISIGGGIKLPTGDRSVEDEFHKLDKEGNDYVVVKPVDQSIQLGDGGVGAFLETQGYLSFSHKVALYFNGFYLSNPRVTNKVNRNPQATTIDPNTGYFSVADQFAGRLGVSYALGHSGISVMLGGRVEGVPSDDLIGSSKGFRRPGYVVSGEPGISYIKNKFSASASVPFALYRNRTKSYADKLDVTGKTQGDAAFADYLISLSVSRWF
jgi:hypothetical protein